MIKIRVETKPLWRAGAAGWSCEALSTACFCQCCSLLFTPYSLPATLGEGAGEGGGYLTLCPVHGSPDSRMGTGGSGYGGAADAGGVSEAGYLAEGACGADGWVVGAWGC